MTLDEYKKKSKKMPDTPGVYFFLGARKDVLYIGKAASIKDRTRSYFAKDIAEVRSTHIANMVEKARYIDWRTTDSVLEALILEANLIKNYKPFYNTAEKDDKSWNYLVITRENFPKVLLVRGKELAQGDFSRPLYQFGPFPHGLQLRAALKLVRRIFPYRDSSCTPCEDQLASGATVCRPCFNRQIGFCPGVCSGEIDKVNYRTIVRRIALLFMGKKRELLKFLERDMKRAAKEERFEDAAMLRKQVHALTHIQDVSLIKEEYRKPNIHFKTRVEAYDVAHLGGSANVGVMTVVEDGQPVKSDYRKFRIRNAKGGDDAAALREILSRRLGHDEWPMPRLIAVDGAAAQVNSALHILKEYGVMIPVVGVVKDHKHRPREIRGDRSVFGGLERDILLANAEAHRFAITYHRKRSRKALLLK